jgi:hypothetical protein
MENSSFRVTNIGKKSYNGILVEALPGGVADIIIGCLVVGCVK